MSFTIDDVSQGDFEDYEGVRESGLVNMGETETISALTDLSEGKVDFIRGHHSALARKYSLSYESCAEKAI